MNNKPKILIFDIEILGIADEILDRYVDIYPGATFGADFSSVISLGYKYYGDKQTHCLNAWDFPARWKKDVSDDYLICKKFYELMKDADAIVTHYGAKFDLPFMQTRLLKHNHKWVLPKIPHIDTFRVAKSKLKISRRKLDSLAYYFNLTPKIKTGGWSLWNRVRKREASACKAMSDYCKQDVILLEEVFEILKPLANNVPNHLLYQDQYQIVCPTCGSPKTQKWGLYHTKLKIFQRHRCVDCGSVFRTNGQMKNPRVGY